MTAADARVTIVVLTHNRREEVLRTVADLRALPDRAHICVVDNGSTDGTAQALRTSCPDVRVIAAGGNAGAAGRNLGVNGAATPYVAFCDDDTCWQAHALDRAADILDRHPSVAVLCAQVRVAPGDRLDPACEGMAASPLPSDGLPGKALLGFLAGASVMRVRAFRGVGGYRPEFFIGAEEALMALDLAAAGWRMAYCPEIVTRHAPSPRRDAAGRRRLLARNEIWTAWLRFPVREACAETVRIVCSLPPATRPGAVRDALAGWRWVAAQRRVVPPHVMQMRRALASPRPAPSAADAPSAVPPPSPR